LPVHDEKRLDCILELSKTQAFDRYLNPSIQSKIPRQVFRKINKKFLKFSFLYGCLIHKKPGPNDLELLFSGIVQKYYHIMILLYFVVGSTLCGSAIVFVPNNGAKTILSQSYFEDNSPPLYFLIRFFDLDQPYICTI
jgi:hypothetical protein